MCQQAGIPGYHTNHSLRATTATHLYQAGVHEQMVMESTGHHSLEGIQSYKRISKEQRIALSDILNCNKLHLDHDLTASDQTLLAQLLAHTSQLASTLTNTSRVLILLLI